MFQQGDWRSWCTHLRTLTGLQLDHFSYMCFGWCSLEDLVLLWPGSARDASPHSAFSYYWISKFPFSLPDASPVVRDSWMTCMFPKNVLGEIPRASWKDKFFQPGIFGWYSLFWSDPVNFYDLIQPTFPLKTSSLPLLPKETPGRLVGSIHFVRLTTLYSMPAWCNDLMDFPYWLHLIDNASNALVSVHVTSLVAPMPLYRWDVLCHIMSANLKF